MQEMLKDCINLIKDEGSDYEHTEREDSGEDPICRMGQ